MNVSSQWHMVKLVSNNDTKVTLFDLEFRYDPGSCRIRMLFCYHDAKWIPSRRSPRTTSVVG